MTPQKFHIFKTKDRQTDIAWHRLIVPVSYMTTRCTFIFQIRLDCRHLRPPFATNSSPETRGSSSSVRAESISTVTWQFFNDNTYISLVECLVLYFNFLHSFSATFFLDFTISSTLNSSILFFVYGILHIILHVNFHCKFHRLPASREIKKIWVLKFSHLPKFMSHYLPNTRGEKT